MAKTIHYYPDAMCVFVKGFRDIETVAPDQLLLTQTKEVVSVSLNMTVGDSPCTFNVTITDPANRYANPDVPATEIANLKANADYQMQLDRTNVNVRGPFPGVLNTYEFDGYKDGKVDWYDFEYGTLIDVSSGHRSVVYYRRNQAGVVVERWAFDERGNAILVSQSMSEATFTNKDSNGLTFPITVRNKDGSTSTRQFELLKKSNSDFVTKYQAGVQEPFKVGRCKIEPMDRVVIFLSQRYERDDKGSFDVIQHEKPKLIRCFTGLVNTVQMGYDENGQNTVTVSGEDVTKWLRLSVVPVNPSALPDQTSDTLRYSSFGKYLLLFTNAFAELTTPQVIRFMCLGSDGLADDVRAKTALVDAKMRGIGTYEHATNQNQHGDDVAADPNAGKIGFIETKSEVAAGTTSASPVQPTNQGVSFSDVRGMLGLLFKKSSVHVEDPTEVRPPLQAYISYKTTFGTPNLFQTEYKTRRDICYDAASQSNFAFYADRNGHVWFHQPRYNNGWILGAQNDKLLIVDDDSIISYGFVEDDTNVYSTCVVTVEPGVSQKTGDVVTQDETGQALARGAYTDEMLAFRFGTKIIELSNPFLVGLGTGPGFSSRAADFFAKIKLQEMLANKTQGQVTITGRAEIDPGYPVYVPFRNTIYYVETVEHNFSFGGRYETTLHLTYGHKPWESVPELLSQNFDLIHASDGHVRLVKGDVTNQPTTSNSGTRKQVPIDDTPLQP